MVCTSRSWRSILAEVKQKQPHLAHPHSFKFKRLIAIEAEKHELSSSQVTELAMHLGIKWYPKPKNIPIFWKLVFCKSYLAQRYVNPMDSSEFIVVAHPGAIGQLPYLIHKTAQGYADKAWFTQVVPELEAIINDSKFGWPLSKDFNAKVNELFSAKGKITPGQVQALNLFFEKFVPGIDEICSTCFQVALPRSGAGERWINRSDFRYEVRLSAAKPDARHECQRVEYVSHTEIDRNNNLIYATWENNAIGFADKMKLKETHIPWEVYDFAKFNVGMPVCQCRKK